MVLGIGTGSPACSGGVRRAGTPPLRDGRTHQRFGDCQGSFQRDRRAGLEAAGRRSLARSLEAAWHAGGGLRVCRKSRAALDLSHQHRVRGRETAEPRSRRPVPAASARGPPRQRAGPSTCPKCRRILPRSSTWIGGGSLPIFSGQRDPPSKPTGKSASNGASADSRPSSFRAEDGNGSCAATRDSRHWPPRSNRSPGNPSSSGNWS